MNVSLTTASLMAQMMTPIPSRAVGQAGWGQVQRVGKNAADKKKLKAQKLARRKNRKK